jgi:hypothetical protein
LVGPSEHDSALGTVTVFVSNLKHIGGGMHLYIGHIRARGEVTVVVAHAQAESSPDAVGNVFPVAKLESLARIPNDCDVDY